jgi:16S rRNA (guanine966-N2)-methyltransferase
MASRTAKANKKPQPGRLRIVAGNWRSRLLQIADVPGLRPTSERVRETLFNWIGPEIAGASCLDLFAGTGALGLEALSRGASRTVFVEKSPAAAKVLQANATSLGATQAHILQTDAVAFLQTDSDDKFDIVFLDPPFASDNISELCRLLDESRILASNARIYLEEDRNRPAPTLPAGWRVLKTKNAGNVRYSLVSCATEV